MKFEPGRKKSGGRVKGTPNKSTKNYLDFQLWFGTIKENMAALEPKEQIEIAFRVSTMLLNKVQNLPGSPEQSLENANARAAIMGALESPAPKPEENVPNVNA